jgi:hypothetical protein
MYTRTILLTFTATLATFASAASPPGCLLGAVNTYKDPADLSAVCKDKGAAGKVAKYCGDNAEIAWEAFVDVCKEEGVDVCKYTEVSYVSCFRASLRFPPFPMYFDVNLEDSVRNRIDMLTHMLQPESSPPPAPTPARPPPRPEPASAPATPPPREPPSPTPTALS